LRISIPVSAGELLDRITILRIKSDRMDDVSKLENVREELAGLEAILDRELAPSEEISDLVDALEEVNATLWEVEDELRENEATSTFGDAFVESARSVYRLNDERHRLKRAISTVCGSDITEEKSYAGS